MNKIKEIACSQEGCKLKYNDEQIKAVVTTEYFEKLLRFRTKNRVNSNPDLKWCIRARCEKIIKIIPEAAQLSCECGMVICAKCNLEWHGTRTCKSVLDEEYKKYAQDREILRCPQCRNGTEKSEGCNHMTCGMCGFEWCWLCKGEYTQDHFNSLNPFGCPGLQNGVHNRFTCNSFARYALKLGVCLFWVVWVLMIPFVLLGLSIVWPIVLYKRNNYHLNKNKARVFFEGFGLLLIGLITFPLTFAVSLVITIVPGSCIALSRYIHNRKRMLAQARERRIQNMMRARGIDVDEMQNMQNLPPLEIENVIIPPAENVV